MNIKLLTALAVCSTISLIVIAATYAYIFIQMCGPIKF